MSFRERVPAGAIALSERLLFFPQPLVLILKPQLQCSNQHKNNTQVAVPGVQPLEVSDKYSTKLELYTEV